MSGDGDRGPAGEDSQPPGGISCEEALARVYEYLDGELEAEAQEKVHRHLEVCRRCYPFFDFERLFLDYVAQKGLSAQRTARLEAKVRSMLDEAQ